MEIYKKSFINTDEIYNDFLINFNHKNLKEINIGNFLYELNNNSSYKDLMLIINLMDYNRNLGCNLTTYLNRPFNAETRENSVKKIIKMIESDLWLWEKFQNLNIQLLTGLNFLFAYIFEKLNEKDFKFFEYYDFDIENKDYLINKIDCFLYASIEIAQEIYKKNGMFLEDKFNYSKIYQSLYFEISNNFKLQHLELENDEILNKLIKQKFGLDFKEINLIIEKLISDEISIKNNEESFFKYNFIGLSSITFEKELFYENYIEELSIGKECFFKFFDFMIYNINYSKIRLNDWGLRKNHIVRQPVIKFNVVEQPNNQSKELYYSTPGLIFMFLQTFKLDILDRQAKDININGKIHHIIQCYDIKFEEIIFNEINKKTNFKSIHGIKFKWLTEVDILIIAKKNIYIIECKNSSLYLYPKELNNATKRISDINKKMEKKIKGVNNNKEKIAKILNVDLNFIKDMKVKGIIVTSEIPIQFLNNYIKYDVYSASEFTVKINELLN
ncbi:NERD domain-containing protein [Clostridium perfringens]|nr:NERD domain-containing protein [Clostridium perfringens]